MFTKTSLHYYENVCSLDWLGVEEKHKENNEFVYGEFTVKPTLPGKKIILHYVVVNNVCRVHSLTVNLIRPNKFGEYNKIIQEQMIGGIIEKVNEAKTPKKGKEFYLPHTPVI